MNSIQLDLLVTDLMGWVDQYNYMYKCKASEQFLINAFSRCLEINEEKLTATIYKKALAFYQKEIDEIKRANEYLYLHYITR